MATLSSSIVKNEVASMRDVEEALARQVLYGGDLATNLLELAAVSEAALTRLQAILQDAETGRDLQQRASQLIVALGGTPQPPPGNQQG